MQLLTFQIYLLYWKGKKTLHILFWIIVFSSQKYFINVWKFFHITFHNWRILMQFFSFHTIFIQFFHNRKISKHFTFCNEGKKIPKKYFLQYSHCWLFVKIVSIFHVVRYKIIIFNSLIIRLIWLSLLLTYEKYM